MPRGIYTPRKGSIGLFFSGDNSLRRYFQLEKNVINGTSQNITATKVGSGQELFTSSWVGGNVLFFSSNTSNFAFNLDDNLNYTNLTNMIWFRALPYNTEYRIFFHVGGDPGVGHYWGFSCGIYKSDETGGNAGKIIFGAYFETGYNLTTPQRYDDGKWHFLCQIRNGNQHYGYIDGNLVVNGTISTTQTQPGGDSIGYNRDYTNNYMKNGYLTEHAVFTRALSLAEIRGYYMWATSSPKKYWYFGVSGINPAIFRRRLLLK